MSKKTLALVLSAVMGLAFASFGILGCGDDEPRPIVPRYVPQAVTVIPVTTASALSVLEQKCFNFPNGAFLDAALAAVPLEFCYKTKSAATRLPLEIRNIPETGMANATEYLGSLMLQIQVNSLGIPQGTYEIEQDIFLGRDGVATKSITNVLTGVTGQSDPEVLCESLTCDTAGSLVCDGVKVGSCVVTGSFGG